MATKGIRESKVTDDQVVEAFRRTGGNLTATAAQLKLTRMTLHLWRRKSPLLDARLREIRQPPCQIGDEQILACYLRHRGDLKAAAAELKIHPTTLYRRKKRFPLLEQRLLRAKAQFEVTDQMIAQAYRRNRGSLAATAAELNLSKETLYRRRKHSRQLEESLIQTDESLRDYAESSLKELIRRGEFKAITFFLKTKGKSRGYSYWRLIRLAEPWRFRTQEQAIEFIQMIIGENH